MSITDDIISDDVSVSNDSYLTCDNKVDDGCRNYYCEKKQRRCNFIFVVFWCFNILIALGIKQVFISSSRSSS